MKFNTVQQAVEYANNYDTITMIIDLSNNHVKHLNGLENIRCVGLNLSLNEITEIPENWNPKCEIVLLDNNNITTIGVGSFSTKYYHYVSFRGNSIGKLNPLWKPTINQLYLNNNSITKIPIDFDLTCNLLDLSFNKIKQLYNFTKLICFNIRLSYNLITKIPDNFYVNCNNIDLQKNNIIYIPRHFSTTIDRNSHMIIKLSEQVNLYLTNLPTISEKQNNIVNTITI